LNKELIPGKEVVLYLGGFGVGVLQGGEISKGILHPRLLRTLPRFKGNIFASVREIFPNRN
jgi:hypothetical protein